MKSQLRARFKARRLAQVGLLQVALDRRQAGDLATMLRHSPVPHGHLGLVHPLPGEPDLRPWLQATGHPLALPAIADGRLAYRPWWPGTALQADACGIPAPPASAGALQACEMALLLVPALAVDRRGVRLGYGGGWYDRLRADPAWRRVPALVVVPAACVCPELPADPWDVPFDGWLDENGVHWLFSPHI